MSKVCAVVTVTAVETAKPDEAVASVRAELLRLPCWQVRSVWVTTGLSEPDTAAG